MPKTNCDYSRTVIYKIVCNDLSITDCYVGHTTEFTKRKCGHKTSCNVITNKSHDYNVYKIIRENGGWDNWSMIEIEKWPCNDGNEARSRERYHYERNNTTLNSDMPARTDEERKKLNIEYQKEYNTANQEYIYDRNKTYRINHKEELKEKKGLKCNCQCGGKYVHNHKFRHLQTKRHLDYIKSLEV